MEWSSVLGWTYFTLWSVSFYPQILVGHFHHLIRSSPSPCLTTHRPTSAARQPRASLPTSSSPTYSASLPTRSTPASYSSPPPFAMSTPIATPVNRPPSNSTTSRSACTPSPSSSSSYPSSSSRACGEFKTAQDSPSAGLWVVSAPPAPPGWSSNA